VGERGTGTRPAWYVVRSGDTLFSIAWRHDLDYQDVARWNRMGPPYLIRPGDKVRLYPPPSSTSTARARSRSPSPSSAPARMTGGWIWPTQGRMIRGFSPSRGSKGIDIAGKLGQPVIAAAAGRVVYQGSGLPGYGRLIIIKHDEVYLSAYAHNEKILVKEGQAVRGGQTIATLGATEADRPTLHFQIRRHGAPVDPLRYLPKRPR